jgi:hypothetical protein
MQKVDAVWEKRNFGCNAYEFSLDARDCTDVQSTISAMDLSELQDSFITVKLPVGQLKMLHALEATGFNFMETQFHISRTLQNYQSPNIVKRFDISLTQQEVKKTPEKWRTVTEMLTENIFTTDRVFLDPLLPFGTSCTRYKNWIMDLVNNSRAHLFLYYKDDIAVGFSLSLFNGDSVNDLLAGVFEPFLSSGYGFLMFDAALTSYSKSGFSKIETSISSNNLPIMKLYQVFGYALVSHNYVLRKYQGAV